MSMQNLNVILNLIGMYVRNVYVKVTGTRRDKAVPSCATLTAAVRECPERQVTCPLIFLRNNRINVGLNLIIFRSVYHDPEYYSTMGKSQKKKVMRRHNPMRVPDSHLPHGLASASQSSSKSNEILPILQRVRAQEILLRHPINLYMLRWKAQTSRSVNGPVSPYQISSRTTHLLGDCSKAKMSLVL